MKAKKIFRSVSVTVASAALLSSCGVKKLDVYSPGENLTALIKVHETEFICTHPNGGDNNRNLFFVQTDKNGHSNIFRKDVPSSLAVVQLTGGNNRHSAPSYCAATNMVAFQGVPDGNYLDDIYMVDANKGGALRQVTSTVDVMERNPCISRDGNKIVYERVRYRGLNRDIEIWMKDLRTNDNIQLGIGMHPAFSPDGKLIVFAKFTTDDRTTLLTVMNVDGTNLRYLTDVSMGVVEHPCFSPDSKRIVFQCTKFSKRDADLYVVNLDGSGNLTQLTVNKSFDGHPYWANDGNIYFTSDRGGKDRCYQIWRFNYGGKFSQPAAREVVSAPASSYQAPAAPVRAVYHTVAEGETITNIAKQYGITVKDVVKWNNLTTMTISEGMRLRVSAQ